MTKHELRQAVRLSISQLTACERAVASQTLCRRVLRMKRWQDARCVLLYAPLPDEVDVRQLRAAALEGGKRVLFPVVRGDELHLVEFTGETVRGAFGIEEPVGERFTDLRAVDLVVVPGRAFDRSGHRLGRGRGYYDRLLPRLSAYLLGVCYECQMVEHLPAELHDVAMDEVIY